MTLGRCRSPTRPRRSTRPSIRCIVYTSPSYVPGTKERWRVLLPTSGPLAPGLRTGLVARLNGIVGGVFAPTESFTLSQIVLLRQRRQQSEPSGQDPRRRLHRSAARSRRRGDLQGRQHGRHGPGHQPSPQASGQPSEPWEDLVVKILAGDVLHPNLVALVGQAGDSREWMAAAVENFLRGLLEKSAAPQR